MIVVHPETLDSCVSNILLQNIANTFSKTLVTHFIEQSELNITMKYILKWYIEKETKQFLWIVGHIIDFEKYLTIENILREYPNTKVVWVEHSTTQKQQQMLDKLLTYKNFKHLQNGEASFEIIYNFMITKNYPVYDLYPIIQELKEYSGKICITKNSYMFNLIYEEFGFYHFKEVFLKGYVSPGIHNLTDEIIERKRKHLQKLTKQGVIQRDETGIIAITDDCLNDLVYITKGKYTIINMVQTSYIKLFCDDIQGDAKTYLENIKLTKFFSSEISKIEYHKNYANIYIKDKIKYEAVVNILKYLHSEIVPF